MSNPIVMIGPYIPIFMIGTRILILRRVRGSPYSDRSVDLYILAGTWFPIFWPVHGFLYSQRYPRYSHYENDSFYLIGVDMTYLTFTIPFNL